MAKQNFTNPMRPDIWGEINDLKPNELVTLIAFMYGQYLTKPRATKEEFEQAIVKSLSGMTKLRNLLSKT